MEILENVGEVAKHILSIVALIGLVWTAAKYLPRGYRWLRSWTFIKREEVDRLKEIEAQYENLERAKPRRVAVLESSFIKPPIVNVEREFDPRAPFKNSK